MKKGSCIFSILLDILLVFTAIIRIINGKGEFFDYFIFVGEVVLVIPGTILYYRKKKCSEKTEFEDNIRD